MSLEARIDETIEKLLPRIEDELDAEEAMQLAHAVNELADARAQVTSDEELATLADGFVGVPDRLERIEQRLDATARSAAD